MGSPRYGCSRSWRDGRLACDNRITVRAKVADPALLSGVQDELLHPKTVAYITAAVSTAVQESLVQRPQAREHLLSERDSVTRKVQNLVQAVENGVALSALQDAITARQAELRRIDDDLTHFDDRPSVKLAVIPTWIRDQLCAGLLGDAPERPMPNSGGSTCNSLSLRSVTRADPSCGPRASGTSTPCAGPETSTCLLDSDLSSDRHGEVGWPPPARSARADAPYRRSTR